MVFVKMAAEKIVHPLFARLRELTTDEYWIDALSACARGRMPIGVRYDPNVSSLSVKRGKNREVYRVSPTDLPRSFATVMRIFTELGMSSAEDQDAKGRLAETMGRRKADQFQSWREIKSKLKKHELIEEFAHAVCADPRTAKRSAAILANGLQFKRLKGEDITMRDGKIVQIHGVEWHEDAACVSLCRPLTHERSKSKAKTRSPLMNAIASINTKRSVVNAVNKKAV